MSLVEFLCIQRKSEKYCASYLLDVMPSQGVFLRDLPYLGQLLLKVVFSGREAAATLGGALATPRGSSVGFTGPTAPSPDEHIMGSRSGCKPEGFIQLYFNKDGWESDKKTQTDAFFVTLVGFGGLCSRSFTLWVVKKEKSLPGCPAHGEVQNKGIASGISQILQDSGFFSKHGKGEAKENTASEWTGGQQPHQSALPRPALALVGAKTIWLMCISPQTFTKLVPDSSSRGCLTLWVQ